MKKTIYQNEMPPTQMRAEDTVKVVRFGNRVELRWCNQTRKTEIHRLPPDERIQRQKSDITTIDTVTGEVITSERYKTRYHAVHELRDAYYLMLNNVRADNKSFEMTLRYNDDITDYKKLSRDMNNYHNAVRKLHPSYQYIDIIERGNRMTFHCHEYMLFDETITSEQQETLRSLWHEKGQTHLDTITDDKLDRIASYTTKYSTDIQPLDFACDIDPWHYCYQQYEKYTVEEQRAIKHYVKNYRLSFFPNGARIYRASRDLIRPLCYNTSVEDAMNEYQNATLLHSQTTKLTHDTSTNIYYYEQYMIT